MLGKLLEKHAFLKGLALFLCKKYCYTVDIRALLFFKSAALEK